MIFTKRHFNPSRGFNSPRLASQFFKSFLQFIPRGLAPRSLIKIFLLVVFGFMCFLSFTVSAQSKIDSLKTSIEQEQKLSLKVLKTIDLSREIHRNAHNAEEEYSYANKAVNTALTTNDTLLYARALDNLGLLRRFHQEYAEALALHGKAFNLIKNRKVKPIYKMIIANNAGVAGRYNQQYDRAIAFYMEALKIAEKEKDTKNIAISSNGLGNALGNISGREEEALAYYQRSLAAEKQIGSSLGIAMNLLSISDYYINKEEFKTARKYLDRLLKINKERNDRYGLGMTYQFYGKSYLKEGKELEKAGLYFQNALKRFKELNDKHKEADLLFSLGEVQSKQNLSQEAQKSYLNSLELAQEFRHHGLIMDNSYKLAQLYENKNKPSQALKYVKQAKVYEDSIKFADQQVEIAALVRKYDLEKKENFIELLKKDKALQQTLLENQEQKLKRRRIFILLLALIIVAIIVIGFLQYRNRQIKRKTNILVQQEEQEKVNAIYERNLAQAEILSTRLQINPHFLFNSLNAIKYLIQSEQNQKASKYLIVFSRYTRMVLETSKKHVVTLPEEIQLTRYYLTLESNRFEKDFTYQINDYDEKKLEKAVVPPLLLQPFIENAIWHGLLPSKRDEKILRIEIIPEDKAIKIVIDDNGVGRQNKKSVIEEKPHDSMGMQITRDRIELYNKSHAAKLHCKVIDKKDEKGQPIGTRVILEITKPD